jgi:hypothetical protein
MGGGLPGRQGLAIKTLAIQFTPAKTKSGKALPKGRLVRTSESAVVGDPGIPAAGAQAIRMFGLKVGMRFRNAHKVVSIKWASGNALPGTAAFKNVNKSQPVTKACEDVFGKAGQWYGFTIPGNAIVPPMPLPYPADQDRLYFIVTVDNFRYRHPMDFHEVPVAVILGNFPDFKQHYALGVGLFTIGKGNQSIQFDTQVIGEM